MLGAPCSPCCGCSVEAAKKVFDEVCASSVSATLEGLWPESHAYATAPYWIVANSDTAMAESSPDIATDFLTGVTASESPIGSHSLSLSLNPAETQFLPSGQFYVRFRKQTGSLDAYIDVYSSNLPSLAAQWSEGSPCKVAVVVKLNAVRQRQWFSLNDAKEKGLVIGSLSGSDSVLPVPSGPTQEEIDLAIATTEADLAATNNKGLGWRDVQYAGWTPPTTTTLDDFGQVPFGYRGCPAGEVSYVIKQLLPEYIDRPWTPDPSLYIGGNISPLYHNTFPLCSGIVHERGVSLSLNNPYIEKILGPGRRRGYWSTSPSMVVSAPSVAPTAQQTEVIGSLYQVGKNSSADIVEVKPHGAQQAVKHSSLVCKSGAQVFLQNGQQWRSVPEAQQALSTRGPAVIASHPTIEAKQRYAFSVSWEIPYSGSWARLQGRTFYGVWQWTETGALARLSIDSAPVDIGYVTVPSNEYNISDVRVTIG